MEYGLSTRLFAGERLRSRLLDRILEHGFRQIEIFAAPEHLDYHDVHHVRDVSQWFRDLGVALHSVHAPVRSAPRVGRRDGFAISVAALERRLRIDSMDEIKRTLEVAERLPFRFMVLHLGLDEAWSLEKFDAAFTSIEHLNLFAKEREVRLLLENTTGELGAPARLVHFLDYTHLNDVGICFDAGHAHLGGDSREAFRTVRARVASVHLHDNRGEKDEHLMPFGANDAGNLPAGGAAGEAAAAAKDAGIDWPGLIQDLAASSESGNFCNFLEIQDRGPEATSLERVRDVKDKLMALETTVEYP